MDNLLQLLQQLRDLLDFGGRLSALAVDAANAVSGYWTRFVIETTNASAGAHPLDFVTDPTIEKGEPLAQAVADVALAPIAMWAFYRVMFGHGMFTQYTARIMLPRTVIAAGTVNFARPLVQAAVDMDNALSQTVLRASVGRADLVNMVHHWGSDVAPGVPGLGEIVTLAMLAGFVVLGIAYVIRYAVLVLLAILAPLAAVMLVLPDTQHYAREWGSLFISTLLMQPLQLLILEIGLGMEGDDTTILRHGFALAALWMCFKVPGALHSAASVGSHAHSFAKHQADHALKAATKYAQAAARL